MAEPVMLYSLDGFIDAGAAGGLVTEHLLSVFEHRAIATFDIDRLIDYRSRRPIMTFVKDHWQDYDLPGLELHAMRDGNGTPFLLFTGPEPDHEWNLFVAAVLQLVERLDVRVAVSYHGIPMAAPHTRPLGLTAHATRPELVAGHTPFLNRVQVPGSASALLELRLGEAGRDAIGFAVHVPHYLAQSPYPAAALTALDAITSQTGLAIPAEKLRERAQRADAEIARQVEGSEEIKSLVHALEEQYEAYASAGGRDNLLADDSGNLPTAEELAAQFEQFLAQQDRPGDNPDH
ncbi:MAG: proteasome assembly chaperone family protein [Micromonosporaceae bacterium]